MININLLPEPMRTQKKVRQARQASAISQKIMVFGLSGGAALIVLSWALLVLLPSWWTSMRLSHWDARWEDLEAEYAKVEVFDKQLRRFSVRLAELNAKSEARVRWATVLNALSDLTPPSVQLTRLKAGQLVEMIPEPPKPNQPPPSPTQGKVVVPKIRHFYQALELEGLVERGLLGEQDLTELLEGMRSDPVFDHYFDRIEIVGVMRQEDLKKRFSLRCRFKEGPS